MIEKILVAIIFVSFMATESNANGFGSSNSCEVTARKQRCRNMNNTPTTDEWVEINGCSVSCPNQARAVCEAGYLTSNNCNDWVEPSRCYCN